MTRLEKYMFLANLIGLEFNSYFSKIKLYYFVLIDLPYGVNHFINSRILFLLTVQYCVLKYIYVCCLYYCFKYCQTY